jgi:hypothetical protein
MLGSSETSILLRNVKEAIAEENKENEVDLSPIRRKDNQLPIQLITKPNKYISQPNSKIKKEEIK